MRFIPLFLLALLIANPLPATLLHQSDVAAGSAQVTDKMPMPCDDGRTAQAPHTCCQSHSAAALPSMDLQEIGGVGAATYMSVDPDLTGRDPAEPLLEPPSSRTL